MGAPSINIKFYEQAVASIKKGDKGTIALILVESTAEETTLYTIYDTTDIPDGLSDAGTKQIKKALIGYQSPPKKIFAVVIPSTDDYNDALAMLEMAQWDYLACPTVETDGKTSDIASWIKSQRSNNHKIYKAVLPNSKSDHEGIINVTMGYTDEDGTELTAEQVCARVAGIIAGTPMKMACTYAPITEALACPAKTQEELDTAVDAGELVFMWDGEKVKIVRGVNSFVTTTSDKGESYQKIKLVETMDMVNNDIRTTIQDSYVGKYPNSYDNKCLLTTAITGYYDTLVDDGLLESGSCDIDIKAQRTWIKSNGGKFILDGQTIKLENATDEQIKKANTKARVFLTSTIGLIDAMEDFVLEINI